MPIPGPTFEPGDMKRSMECEQHFDLPIRDLIDQAVTAGWTALEALIAIEEVVKEQRQAYQADPDPAVALGELEPAP
ncbi:hypothetical protein P6U16_20170 [Rhizobium sp. 32-5/1]|uniref:hypothetical protein n=1 Tax=Rhizobium sp. 32-5/1 TaxID=3019602 RepID=UPI00240D6D7D|nr:hypothetical protein [Rhizobium sp. 32-5/1]WEZ83162.1 hypothetical protein P6U16_20170 [Rhizobium sp. 32-5/1]